MDAHRHVSTVDANGAEAGCGDVYVAYEGEDAASNAKREVEAVGLEAVEEVGAWDTATCSSMELNDIVRVLDARSGYIVMALGVMVDAPSCGHEGPVTLGAVASKTVPGDGASCCDGDLALHFQCFRWVTYFDDSSQTPAPDAPNLDDHLPPARAKRNPPSLVHPCSHLSSGVVDALQNLDRDQLVHRVRFAPWVLLVEVFAGAAVAWGIAASDGTGVAVDVESAAVAGADVVYLAVAPVAVSWP